MSDHHPRSTHNALETAVKLVGHPCITHNKYILGFVSVEREARILIFWEALFRVPVLPNNKFLLVLVRACFRLLRFLGNEFSLRRNSLVSNCRETLSATFSIEEKAMTAYGDEHRQGGIEHVRLLEPTPLPSGFKRKNPKAFRFQPYSRKIRRRLDIYTPILYDLWVSIEWDTSVRTFNERVAPIPIGETSGKVFYFSPAIVTMGKEGEYIVHSLQEVEFELDSRKLESLENWAKTHHIKHRIWSPEEIRSNPVELENRKQLYAYISSPEAVIAPAFREKVLLVLRRYRKTTLDDLVKTLCDATIEQVIQIVAEQILQRNIYSDIHTYQFGWSTEISSFHEFP